MQKRATASLVLVVVLLVAAIGVWTALSGGTITGNAPVMTGLSHLPPIKLPKPPLLPPPNPIYKYPSYPTSTVTTTTLTSTTSSTYYPESTVTTITVTSTTSSTYYPESTVTTTTLTSTTTSTTPDCTSNLQCDDGNDCTQNTCSAGKCVYPKLHCTFCSIGFCDRGQCVNVAAMPTDCNENYGYSPDESSSSTSYLPPPATPCERVQRILAVANFFTNNCRFRYVQGEGVQVLLSVQLGNQGP